MTAAEATRGAGGPTRAAQCPSVVRGGGLQRRHPGHSVSLGGLAGNYLLDADKSLATLPVSGFNIGVAPARSPPPC